ncbi:MAG: hypothetical protein JNL80_12095 [Phycisphaerae bacterium]|nr:hypothetical protein [Phycisphaerae bacterium]
MRTPLPLARRSLIAGFALITVFVTMTGCESEPKRSDVRVDPQRVDKVREDKILPTWGKPKEKSWWE